MQLFFKDHRERLRKPQITRRRRERERERAREREERREGWDKWWVGGGGVGSGGGLRQLVFWLFRTQVKEEVLVGRLMNVLATHANTTEIPAARAPHGVSSTRANCSDLFLFRFFSLSPPTPLGGGYSFNATQLLLMNDETPLRRHSERGEKRHVVCARLIHTHTFYLVHMYRE